MNAAEAILLGAKIWAGIGGLVAVVFLTFGIDRIDEDANGAFVFRLLLIPGILLIWPMVLWRWYILADGKDEWSHRYRPRRQSHYLVALIMPVAIVLVIVAGLSVRQTWPDHIATVQLSEPAGATQ